MMSSSYTLQNLDILKEAKPLFPVSTAASINKAQHEIASEFEGKTVFSII